MDNIEFIMSQIKLDPESELHKWILNNCQWVEWYPDMVKFRYKGYNYVLQLKLEK